jgi:dTMP kinase
MVKGRLITFEGPEGSGKTTHIALLAAYLRSKKYPVLVTREPGGTKLAAGIRKLLLDGGEGLSPMAELFLYEADRAQHVHEALAPALQQGKIVLCDRYTDSTVAYQGFGRGLDMKAVQTLNAIASSGLKPDLTLLLDVPVERGLKQAKRKKHSHDRMERAGLAFHQRVRKGFLRLAKTEPRRFRVIPQQDSISATQLLILHAVDSFLKK